METILRYLHQHNVIVSSEWWAVPGIFPVCRLSLRLSAVSWGSLGSFLYAARRPSLYTQYTGRYRWRQVNIPPNITLFSLNILKTFEWSSVLNIFQSFTQTHLYRCSQITVVFIEQEGVYLIQLQDICLKSWVSLSERSCILCAARPEQPAPVSSGPVCLSVACAAVRITRDLCFR